MFKNFISGLSLLRRKHLSKKVSYSFGGVDLLVDYIFKDKKNGTYMDIGAQNPYSNNNTYLLYKRGWKGTNIDLDLENIKLFDIARNKDRNICTAVSSKIAELDLYFFHSKSPINTVEKIVADNNKAKFTTVKKIKATTLNFLFESNNIEHVNYLNIDVEGHELDVLKGFDLIKYKPDVMSIEYLDLEMKKLEFKNNKLENILDSDLYAHMVKNNYSLVNWNHADLIFVNNNFKD